MALHIEELDHKNFQQLQAVRRQYADKSLASRVQIVLLSAEGKGVPEISHIVKLHPINVRKWIHRFRSDGIDGLRSSKSPGRPRLFTEEQRRRILVIANTPPQSLGLHAVRWSLQRLRRHLVEQGIVKHISVETIRQILHAGDRISEA